ncbi:Uncharacterised protein [Mycobacteroides abscessus subsp. bolletii]|nr:Uncharacterised protein [Mycobacteroides abscessus subsp. bolletii]SHY65902.1 Uncharacterised protein [Mycobacteroides abscessus subsp. bolletii]
MILLTFSVNFQGINAVTFEKNIVTVWPIVKTASICETIPQTLG